MKQRLLSLTKKDFRIEFYRGTGNGGQKKNKTSSACRITHIETGIQSTCEEYRSQPQNKIEAFNKLCNNEKFKTWLKIESMRVAGILKTTEEIEKEVDKIIERDLANGNIKIEEV